MATLIDKEFEELEYEFEAQRARKRPRRTADPNRTLSAFLENNFLPPLQIEPPVSTIFLGDSDEIRPLPDDENESVDITAGPEPREHSLQEPPAAHVGNRGTSPNPVIISHGAGTGASSIAPVVIVHQTETRTIPHVRRENLNNAFEKLDHIRVFQRKPRQRHLPVISQDAPYFIKFKRDDWQKEIQNEFASNNIVSVTSQESYTKFRSMLYSVRAQMEADKVIRVPDAVAVRPQETMATVVKEMWVDKFRPHRYVELLSDEGVNRALMHWIKLWDPTVFGKLAKSQDPYRDFGKRKTTKATTGGKSVFNQRKFGAAPDFCFTVDLDKRPRFKAALLCGPPGLGKTTLAHVIARQAGYDTLEINASDDRALEVFRNRVESTVMNGNIATLMLNGTDHANRPKCLIIDEIDGAPANTVEYLVKLMKGDVKSVTGKKNSGKKLGLLRPIICICNDQYVPALKSLRQATMVLQVPTINRDRLTQRLYDICRGMHVEADSSVLYSLCEKSDDDIRTCLNSLQFTSIEGKRMNIYEVTKATIGCKDHQKQLFAIWNTVFQLPKVFRPTDPRITAHQPAGPDRVGQILQLVQLGELEKIIAGVYENYLLVHHRDSTLKTASHCADWMAYVDLMDRGVHEHQHWFLMGYMNFYAVAINLYLASEAVPKLNFPLSQFEFHRKRTKNKEIMDALLKDLSPKLYRTTKSASLSHEIVPSLLQIIQPHFKAVSLHLLSRQDRLELKRVVDVMISYGMSYREECGVNVARHMVFDPQLESIACYPGVQLGPLMSTAAREMILREVQMQQINVGADGEKEVAQAPIEIPETPPPALVVNSAISTRNKAVNTSKLQVWSVHDYFRQQNPSQAPKPVGVENKQRIFYRYKEGSSNAVCRNIKIKDLM